MSTFEQNQTDALNGMRSTPADYRGVSLDLIQRLFIWLFIASGWFVIIEPAPYEMLFLLTLILMLPNGLRFHAATMPMLFFLILYNIGGAISMWPVSGLPDTKKFVIISVYMAATGIFVSNLVADDTERRMAIIKNAYVIAAVIATINGLIGYFNIGGMEATWAPLQRAQGTFKDPNVYSTFIIPPFIFLVQGLVLGKQKWPVLSALALLFISAGLFFAFSRGAWVNSAGSAAMLIGLMFLLTPSPRLRTRIILLSIFGLIALAVMIAGALSVEKIRLLFLERANFLNSYDAGETGRFGNQLRSLSYLLELPNGFGPLQFSKHFFQDPHNVYLNAFASYGWLGGFSYFALTLSTIYIGFKTVFTRSPWQWTALAVWCPLFFVMLQGIQIDTDHWRHFHLLLGLMWGLYAATENWRRQNVPDGPNAI